LATTLLPAAAWRLIELRAAAMFGIVSHLADLAHVVAILNHELATQAIRLVSILCHTKLLSPRALVRRWRHNVKETVSTQCHRVAKRVPSYRASRVLSPGHHQKISGQADGERRRESSPETETLPCGQAYLFHLA
jgi:hypothetical protein